MPFDLAVPLLGNGSTWGPCVAALQPWCWCARGGVHLCPCRSTHREDKTDTSRDAAKTVLCPPLEFKAKACGFFCLLSPQECFPWGRSGQRVAAWPPWFSHNLDTRAACGGGFLVWNSFLSGTQTLSLHDQRKKNNKRGHKGGSWGHQLSHLDWLFQAKIGKHLYGET